jgi:rubrerythrin
MSQAASAPAKVCVLCKQDVSKKPRVKDPQGRYLCEPCFEKSQKATPKPAAAAPKPAPKPAPVPADDNPLLDSLDSLGDAGVGDMVLPEGYDPSLAMAAATAKPEAPVRAHQPMPVPGQKEAKKKKKGAPAFACRHCGYDMAGSMTLRCPECGKMNMQPKSDALLDDARQIKRAMYIRPLVLTAIGLTISLIALVAGGAKAASYVVVFGGWLLAIPFGVFTFWICSLIFLEYDAPFHVTALRLAGIYACVGVGDAIGYATGMHVFGWASFGLLILLYMTELEMEKWEAIGMAIAGIVIKFAMIIGLAVVAGMIFGAVTGAAGGPVAGPAVAPTPTPLVSPSNPSAIYYDDNGDGVDDATGTPVPTDAVPADEGE